MQPSPTDFNAYLEKTVSVSDPETAAVMAAEYRRQSETLELIASENIVSPAVQAAQGSILTNKYAEGYPSRRYYGGCTHMDTVEDLARDRACRLFGAEHANVQPHSGSQANMAAYFALLRPGAVILGMDLAHGGHLTHGSHVSFSGNLFQFEHYGVKKETGRIDYDALARQARACHPQMIVAGASAYPRVLDFTAFAQIAADCGALLMVDMAHISGLVAAGLHPSPVGCADVTTSTTHKTLRGPRGGLILTTSAHAKAIDRQVFPGIQGGPLMHIIAARAIAFNEALQPDFRIYQQKIIDNAVHMAACFKAEGVKLVSDGTDNHMLLLDLSDLEITGKAAEEALDSAGITVNKNAIPFDTKGPNITSGIRLGTPAVTSRAMGRDEVARIVKMVTTVLKNPDDTAVRQRVKDEARQLCAAFPLPSA